MTSVLLALVYFWLRLIWIVNFAFLWASIRVEFVFFARRWEKRHVARVLLLLGGFLLVGSNVVVSTETLLLVFH